MQKEFITNNARQTQKIGEILAKELRGGEVIALSGDLGAGKTTFTQGLLKGLKVKGPYTSPTFVIMKQYQKKKEIRSGKKEMGSIFHIDAYRVNAKDILSLGWDEIAADPKNIVIIEWAERIRGIIPKSALWIRFEWAGKEERKITFNSN